MNNILARLHVNLPLLRVYASEAYCHGYNSMNPEEGSFPYSLFWPIWSPSDGMVFPLLSSSIRRNLVNQRRRLSEFAYSQSARLACHSIHNCNLIWTVFSGTVFGYKDIDRSRRRKGALARPLSEFQSPRRHEETDHLQNIQALTLVHNPQYLAKNLNNSNPAQLHTDFLKEEKRESNAFGLIRQQIEQLAGKLDADCCALSSMGAQRLPNRGQHQRSSLSGKRTASHESSHHSQLISLNMPLKMTREKKKAIQLKPIPSPNMETRGQQVARPSSISYDSNPRRQTGTIKAISALVLPNEFVDNRPYVKNRTLWQNLVEYDDKGAQRP